MNRGGGGGGEAGEGGGGWTGGGRLPRRDHDPTRCDRYGRREEMVASPPLPPFWHPRLTAMACAVPAPFRPPLPPPPPADAPCGWRRRRWAPALARHATGCGRCEARVGGGQRGEKRARGEGRRSKRVAREAIVVDVSAGAAAAAAASISCRQLAAVLAVRSDLPPLAGVGAAGGRGSGVSARGKSRLRCCLRGFVGGGFHCVWSGGVCALLGGRTPSPPPPALSPFSSYPGGRGCGRVSIQSVGGGRGVTGGRAPAMPHPHEPSVRAGPPPVPPRPSPARGGVA